MRSRGLPSPDRADALLGTLYAPPPTGAFGRDSGLILPETTPEDAYFDANRFEAWELAT